MSSSRCREGCETGASSPDLCVSVFPTAVVVSTVLIIIFAEIIPQSICSRYGLLVGAKAARMTQVCLIALSTTRFVRPDFADLPVPSSSQILIYVAYPVAKPVSLLLEKILGSHNGIIYRKAELRELVGLSLQHCDPATSLIPLSPSPICFFSSIFTLWLECTVEISSTEPSLWPKEHSIFRTR